MPIITTYYRNLFSKKRQVKERYITDENGVKNGLYQSYHRNGHVTEWQYFDNAKAEEGELTRQRQKYVCGDALDEAVRGLGLEKYLLLEGGKANVGKKTISSLFETDHIAASSVSTT